ncbi:flippase [Thiorhodococcus minor]|uniref:flippase n=1 Tax=Thiorhodococcus minor TaxID=57489 RepID=UPI001ADC16B8
MSNLLIRYLPSQLRVRLSQRPGLLKILGNMGWLFFDKAVRMGVGLLVGVWVARYLGPEQFGKLSYAIAFVALFGPIATMGLPGILVRDLVREPDRASELLGTGAALQVMGGLLALLLAVSVVAFTRPDDPLMKTMVALIGFSLLFKAVDPIRYWFDSRVESKYAVWGDAVVLLTAAGVRVGLILVGAPLIAFVGLLVVEAALTALVLVFVYRRTRVTTDRWRFRIAWARKLLRNSWPLAFSGVAVMIYMKIDQVMLGAMLNDDAVGIYSAAVRISELWYFIPLAIASSVFPAILDAKRRSDEEYHLRLQQLFDMMVWLAASVALLMTLAATPIVIFLFGPEYSSAGGILALHIWAAVFVFLGVASGKWFLAENRQVLSLQRTALGALTNVLLNLWLIPRAGATGAALATVCSYGLAAMFFDVFQKETRFLFFMKARSFNLLRVFSVTQYACCARK